MKVSEITVSNIVDYLKLETGEYTTDTMTMLLDTAKAFILSYTGIKEREITDEVIGTGDGVTKEFLLAKSPLVTSTIAISKGETLQTKDTDYFINDSKTGIIFATAPEVGSAVTASYKTGLDAFDEFVIVVYVLCQDMNDNRRLYVDKTNLNKVVDTILGMHCVNLL